MNRSAVSIAVGAGSQAWRGCMLYLRVLALVAFLATQTAHGQACGYQWSGPAPVSQVGYFPSAVASCKAADFLSCRSDGTSCTRYTHQLGPLLTGSLTTNNAVYFCETVSTTWGTPGYCRSGLCTTVKLPDGASTAESPADSCGFYVRTVAQPVSCPKACVGDPINPAVGNVFFTESDLSFAGPGTVAFRRFYNSADGQGADGVPGWRHSYDASITTINQLVTYPGQSPTVSPLYSSAAAACTQGFQQIKSAVPAWANATASYNGGACVLSTTAGTIGTLQVYSTATPAFGTTVSEYDLTREDGLVVRFPVEGGVIVNPTGLSLRLAVTSTGFTVTDDQDAVEVYNSNGVLQSITSRGGVVQTLSYDANGVLTGVSDSFGNTLTLNRNVQGSIANVTTNSGSSVLYGYNNYLTLSSVTYPDNTSRAYLYQNASFVNAMTGLVDESGTQSSSWDYDTQGRATSTQEAGGANGTTLTYNADGSVDTVDALGAARTYTYSRVGDFDLPVSISGSHCPRCEEMAATTYDPAGWVSSRTDYNGNLTC